jgi:hypothetical protein
MFNMDLHFSAEGAALLSPALRGSGASLVTLMCALATRGLRSLLTCGLASFAVLCAAWAVSVRPLSFLTLIVCGQNWCCGIALRGSDLRIKYLV